MALTLKEQFDLNKIWLKIVIESGFREDTFSTLLGTELGRVGSMATQSADGLMSSSDKVKLDSSLSAPESLTGAGTLSLTNRTSFLTANAPGNAIVLPNGTFDGQKKTITGTSGYTGGNTSIITPSSFFDGTNITFSSRFDNAELEWDATAVAWKLASLSGSAIVA